MQFYVYIIFRPDGRPCYVGKGHGDRWTRTRGLGNPHLARIITKAGDDLPRVKIRDGLTEAEAFEIERALIKAIGREKDGGPLVNLTDGGEGLFNPAPEVRAKKSAALKGRKFSRKSRALMSASARPGIKRKPHSAAHTSAIRAGVSKFWAIRRALAIQAGRDRPAPLGWEGKGG